MMDKTISDDLTVILEATGGSFEGSKVLLTGGAGFLGSWLCDIFIKSGASVTSVDDLSTGLSENIQHLHNEKKFNFMKMNISKEMPEDRYNYVLHFASRVSPEEYMLHPIETLMANSFGTRNALEQALKCDATFLFASSSEIYGNPSIIPTPETYWGYVNPIGPRSCYDEGKRFGEALCKA